MKNDGKHSEHVYGGCRDCGYKNLFGKAIMKAAEALHGYKYQNDTEPYADKPKRPLCVLTTLLQPIIDFFVSEFNFLVFKARSFVSQLLCFKLMGFCFGG